MPLDFQAAYDRLNPADHDYRFYAALAERLGARRVLDLGCGTGTLALLLAGAGHDVVAIDPDPAMLAVARAKPGAHRVDWRDGYADRADTASADLAVMSGHVAQVFVEETAWGEVLAQLHRALVPGGTLAFETRDPAARAWEGWTRDTTLRTVPSEDGPVEVWHETASVALPVVAYDTWTRDLTGGAETRDRDVLAFRDHDAVVGSLRRAGFEVVEVLGDWTGSALSAESPEIVVVARRP